MGGLLAADACISLAKWRPDPAAPLWPNIIACISFDTPYLGLHPWVFKNTASKALGYVDAARSVASGFGFFNGKASAANPTQAQPAALITAPPPEPAAGGNSWTRFLTPAAGYTVGGVLLAGAAAGTAIYHRQDIQKSVNWAQDHMKYVGNLWNEKHLAERVNALMKLSRTKDEGGQGILFRNFYTLLPPKGRLHPQPRTFIILPKPEPASELDPANFFLAAVNNEADDEIAAHTGMFDPKTNDGYYQLGLGAVEIIRTALGEVPLPNAAVGNIVKREERSQHDIEEKHEEEANAQPSPGNHESPLQPQ
ncbi:hypothetical protein FRB99_008712 [Tulasnella sp. 403]|nr:hypothetical protein FRB99_008712 [Tulasnella sp. 403]